MLVWRKGNIDENCLYATVLCSLIMEWCTKIQAVLTGRLTVSGFDLAWFSSLSSKRLDVSSVLMVLYRYYFLLTSFSLPFSELSLVRLALDLVD